VADSGDLQERLWQGPACAAAALLAAAADSHSSQQPAEDAAGAHSGSGPAAASAALPGLFILGRCCWYKAEQLQAATPVLLQCTGLALQPWLQGGACRQGGFLASVQRWLQAGSISQQLAAAGYKPQAVLQQLERLKVAEHWQVIASSSQKPTPEALLAEGRGMRSTGLALCSFAVSCTCNNPECLNMSGTSERRLVIGPSCKCGGCRVARFCSRPCLRAHWRKHKPVCAALAATAAAVGPTGAGAPAGAGTGDKARAKHTRLQWA
jgi:hypothetical protein